MSFNQTSITALLLLFTTVSSVGSANEMYCDKVESKGEGHWPISELRFTKEPYHQAIKFLDEAPDNIKLGMDYVRVETELVFVEGYLIKTAIQTEDPVTIKVFCEFIESEAYVRH